MKKKLLISLILFILLSTYKTQKSFLITRFNIAKIEVVNNSILSEEDVKKDLLFLYEKNLFFLNTLDIEKILIKKSFIESFSIKKIYPNKVKIKIFEKKPIAVLHIKKKKFFISKNIELINYLDLEIFKNLPNIFGNKNDFKKFYVNLNKINFPVEIIKNYYLYQSGRWDIEIYGNKIVKLPSKDYIKSLKNFINLDKEKNFDKYKVIDYRINNQLILK